MRQGSDGSTCGWEIGNAELTRRTAEKSGKARRRRARPGLRTNATAKPSVSSCSATTVAFIGWRAPSLTTMPKPRTSSSRSTSLPSASWQNFDAESGLATWLTRIAVNEALGRLRGRRPSPELSVLDAAPRTNAHVIAFPQMPTHTDPKRGAALKQIRQLIEHAIDELPRRLAGRVRDARHRGHERRRNGGRARLVAGNRESAAAPCAAAPTSGAGCPAGLGIERHFPLRRRTRSTDDGNGAGQARLTARARRRADTTAGEPQAARAQCAQASFHRRPMRSTASC
jgi:hypothetical protein